MGLIVGPVGLWPSPGLLDPKGEGNREIRTDHSSFARSEIGEEGCRRPIDLSARALDDFSIPVIGKPMDNERAYLT